MNEMSKLICGLIRNERLPLLLIFYSERLHFLSYWPMVIVISIVISFTNKGDAYLPFSRPHLSSYVIADKAAQKPQ
nr:unnamed protein product [Haemonchus contortus]